MVGINRPKDKIIVDPATGRLNLEWDAYFSRFEAALVAANTAIEGMVDDAGPVAVVASGAISAAATLDIVLGSADMYEIDLINLLPATDNVELWARFSQSGSFLTGASDYDYGSFSFNARFTDAANDEIVMAQVWGNLSNETGSFTARIFRPSASSFKKAMIFHGGHHSTTGEPIFTAGFGNLIANTDAIDGVRFQFSSGNIASGFYAVRSYSFT